MAEEAFRSVVAACVAHARGLPPADLTLRPPDKRQLLQQNRAERERLREVVRDLTDHLLTHGFALIDHDGKPTRWAVFNVADACVTVGVILLVLFHRSAEPEVPAAP